MQTFLPYSDFEATAQCLDRARLGKQRVETLQLLKALTQGGGWRNHPAAKMWAGYEQALVLYGLCICAEWKARGYKDTCEGKILAYERGELILPPWLGDERFHASHRAALLCKDHAHYEQFGWAETPEISYIWP